MQLNEYEISNENELIEIKNFLDRPLLKEEINLILAEKCFFGSALIELKLSNGSLINAKFLECNKTGIIALVNDQSSFFNFSQISSVKLKETQIHNFLKEWELQNDFI